MYTVSLSAKNNPVSLTGAKAARLSEMINLGFPVPEGFALTTAAFFEFCAYNGIKAFSDNASFEKIRELIKNGDFPVSIKDEIEHSLKKFPFDEFAVRSSSLAEDGMAASMAGQYDTFLCAPKEDVQRRIKDCWAAMFSESVTAYSEKSGISSLKGMGVIVQRQIRPLHAGVIFTMDPLTKSTDRLIIEWADGMGDRVVSGEIDPKRIYVNRNFPVVPDNTDASDILKSELNKIVGYALRAEKHFEHPVDMEWCVDSSGAYVLQARPVTGISGEDLVIWTNINMEENFPDVVTPFTWSIVDTFYKYYAVNMMRLFGWSEKKINSRRQVIHNITGVQGGRIYYNMSNWYEGAHFLPIGGLLRKLLDSFLGQNVPFTFNPCRKDTAGEKFWDRLISNIGFWVSCGRLYFTADGHVENYEKTFYKKRNEWRKALYEGLSLEELLGILDDLFYGFVDRYYYNPAIVDVFAAVFPGGLKILSAKWLSAYSENTDLLSAELMKGVDMRSARPAEIIQLIAEKISRDEKLKTLLADKNYSVLEKEIDGETKELFVSFMLDFGGRCYNDCMMTSPTFEEDHSLFWELVEKYQRAKSDKKSEKNTREIDLIKKLSFFRRMVFRFFLKNSRRAVKMREQSRMIRSLLFGEIRRIALAAGKKLVSKGHLYSPDDVFFLQWKEIEDIAHGKFLFPETLQSLIDERKKFSEKNRGNGVPGFFIRERAKYYEPVKESGMDDLNEGPLRKGLAVSGGKVRAQARVVLDPVRNNRLQPGEILVARSVDPGWTQLFKIAGGLVLERGGMLSHGAIVAREFGIPAVAGISNATVSIKDGDVLLLNGDAGEVEIVG